MRFMIIVKATPESEAGELPPPEAFTEMNRFNEELAKAGVMLAAEGLHSSSKGARVAFNGKERTVTDGPFAETKELIAGFWLLQLRSLDEAIEWAKRIPFEESEVEVRQVVELEDFGDAVPAEVAASEQRMRDAISERQG
jgi:hypothetical protein